MLKKLKAKRLTPANFLQRLPSYGRNVCSAHTRNTRWLIRLALALTLNAWCITHTHADTVYRCGETYSTSSQCAHEAATEVKPSSVLPASGKDKDNAAMRDLRDAQALEKQRLQAERQSAQAAPIRLSTPNTLSPTPPPASVSHNEQLTPKGKHKGQHARKLQSPYFTAVDPSANQAKPKKKSTAKAVPTDSASSP
jgi:hypothetical protein